MITDQMCDSSNSIVVVTDTVVVVVFVADIK